MSPANQPVTNFVRASVMIHGRAAPWCPVVCGIKESDAVAGSLRVFGAAPLPPGGGGTPEMVIP